MNRHKCSLLRDSTSHLPKLLPNANWKARLKRKFHKLLLVSKHHPEAFFYLKSHCAIAKESKRQVENVTLIIHPLSLFRKYWNILIFVVMLMHQILTGFCAGFFVDMGVRVVQKLAIFDAIFCLILLFEILLLFRTGFIVIETNEIVLNGKDIARNYLKSFIGDVLNCLPYTHFMTKIYHEVNSTINGASIIYLLCLFIFSIYRFNRILFYYSSLPLMLNISKTSSTILTICLRTFYLWHWAACVRRLIPLYVAKNSRFENSFELTVPVSKFHVRRMDDSDFESIENIILASLDEMLSNYTIFNKYTRTMMITLKLALQSGYGNETSDSIFNMLMTTFIMISGWIYFAYVLIVISNVFIASAISENKFEELLREIEAFCDAKQLSTHVRKKIKTFINRKFQNHYFNEEAIKQSTPMCLKKEIMMHTCSNLVARVPLFKEMPQNLLENIIGCLQFEIYFPGDIIIQAEALGDSMYFIAYGTAAIHSASGQQLQILCDGSHFGEISVLIKGQKRIASVRALEICEVYKLSQHDFRKVIEPHRDVVRRMEEIAIRRIQNTINVQRFSSQKDESNGI